MGLLDILKGAGTGFLTGGPWGAAIGAGAAALGGALSNKGSTQQQNSITNTNQTTNSTNQGNNTYYGQNRSTYADPASGLFNNQLLQNAYARMGQGVVDPQKFAQSTIVGNIQNINNQEDLQRKAIANIMRQRGLSYSPMGGNALAQLSAQNIGQKVAQINSAPMLERQIANENETILNKRDALFQNLLRTQLTNQENEGFQNTWNSGYQNTQGTQQTQGTVTQPGNMMGGLFQNLGNYLAYNNGRNVPTAASGTNNFSLPSYIQYLNPVPYQY